MAAGANKAFSAPCVRKKPFTGSTRPLQRSRTSRQFRGSSHRGGETGQAAAPGGRVHPRTRVGGGARWIQVLAQRGRRRQWEGPEYRTPKAAERSSARSWLPDGSERSGRGETTLIICVRETQNSNTERQHKKQRDCFEIMQRNRYLCMVEKRGGYMNRTAR